MTSGGLVTGDETIGIEFGKEHVREDRKEPCNNFDCESKERERSKLSEVLCQNTKWSSESELFLQLKISLHIKYSCFRFKYMHLCHY